MGYRRRWSTTLARAKGPLATVFSTLSRGCDRVVDHWAGRPGRLPIGGARAGAQALGTVTMGTTAGPGVDGLSFVASLVRSLAWPAAVVVAVVVLRHPSVGWLAVPPRRVKVGPGGGRGRVV